MSVPVKDDVVELVYLVEELRSDYSRLITTWEFGACDDPNPALTPVRGVPAYRAPSDAADSGVGPHQ